MLIFLCFILFGLLSHYLFVERSILIELEQVDVEDGEIFGLQLILLSLQKGILAVHEFDHVLQVLPELLAQQLVAGLRTLGRGLGAFELRLVVGGLQPIVLYGGVERCLLVEQVELIALLLQDGLVDGGLCASLVEERYAQREATA